MKKFLRLFVFNTAAFAVISFALPAISFSSNLEILIRASLIYAVLSLFIKPALSMMSLPLNYFTYGLLGWVSNVALLYLVSKIETGYKILHFSFPGFFFQGFILPRFELGSLGTAILISLLISLTTSFLLWLSD